MRALGPEQKEEVDAAVINAGKHLEGVCMCVRVCVCMCVYVCVRV